MSASPRIVPGSGAFIVLIASLMTVTAMSIDINLPAIPTTAVELNTELSTAQLTVTLFFQGLAVGQLFWGPVSDHTGRKPALIAGLLLYVVGTAGCMVAPGIGMLLTMRMVQGFGAGAAAVLGRAVIRDLFEGAQMARILSLALAAFITAPVVAPSIGAIILAWLSWRWIFAFLLFYGALLLVIAWRFLDESLKERHPDALKPTRVLKGLAAIFTDAASRPWSFVSILVFCALSIYLTNSSAVLMSGLGMSSTEFGLAFAVIALFSSAGNILNSRLTRSYPLARIILAALIAAVALAAVNLVLGRYAVGGPWGLVVSVGIFFVTFGPVVANSTSLAVQPHGKQVGVASSALGFSQTAIPALIGGGVAMLFNGTAVPMLTAILLCVSGAMAVAFVATRRTS